MQKNKVENIVIGSGPAGSVTAYTLAKAGKEVLVLEAGKEYSLDDLPQFSIEEMLEKYWNGGTTLTMGSPKVSFVMGKCFGGGSEVNSGLYHRTPEVILEEWKKEFQLAGSGEQEMKEHFGFCEHKLNISYLPENTASKISLKLKEGADKLNWKCLEVPRWFKYGPDGKGRKQSMTETFLADLREMDVPVLGNCAVEIVKKQGKYWKVRCYNGKEFLAENIFLCAGAVQSPAILLRSGISRNIGKSLQMHPTIKGTAVYNEQINQENAGVPVHQVKEFSPLISIGGSISSLPYLSLALSDFSGGAEFARDNWQKMATYYAMIKPNATARIVNVPASKDPLIFYKLTNEDMKNLHFALEKLCELLFASGAVKIFPSIQDDRAILTDIKQFKQKIPDLKRKITQLMTIHLFSSCPMGENKKVCAVNSFGKVFDHKGLYVNDGSIICSAPGVNPQGSIMAFARRNALHFLS